MFTSSADVFRTRQAVGDLREVVQFHRDAVERLARSGADRSAVDAVVSSGSVIAAADSRAYTSILSGAAMPDEDFSRFVVATAILLLDRIQDGGGTDDLYWNFEAFREHFGLADPPVRAAIMNGFRIAERHGKVRLPEPPSREECLTRRKKDVVQALVAEGRTAMVDTVANEARPEVAGRLWKAADHDGISWPLGAAFRYLYERPASMTLDTPDTMRLIPWL